MASYAYYPSSLGLLEIGYDCNAVISLRIVSRPLHGHSPTALTDVAAAQIAEYLAGSRQSFDFPLSPKGTPFQNTVWNRLLTIPYGQTRTYGQIAAAIGSPKAARAVGQAVNRNPIWIVIPCHRIIGVGGKLTGYAGGLELKQQLLDLEQLHK